MQSMDYHHCTSCVLLHRRDKLGSLFQVCFLLALCGPVHAAVEHRYSQRSAIDYTNAREKSTYGRRGKLDSGGLTPCKILCGSNCTSNNAPSSGSESDESDARLVQKSVGTPDTEIALGQAPLGEWFDRRCCSWPRIVTGVCPAALFWDVWIHVFRCGPIDESISVSAYGLLSGAFEMRLWDRPE